MRTFFSPSFFEALTSLSKNLQKRTLEAVAKLRDSPTASGLNIEKVREFPDPTMRSVRVDGKYRLIISIQPDQEYLFLYVGNHDETYKWGRRQRCAWNDIAQMIQLVPVVEAPLPDFTDAPAASAQEQSSVTALPAEEVQGILHQLSREEMSLLGIPEAIHDQARKVRSYDDLEQLMEYLPNEAFETLYHILDGVPLSEIIREARAGLAPQGTDVRLSGNNRRGFIELTSDEALQEILDKGMEAWQIFLHPSQRSLVEKEYKGAVKVSGGAGTGKTVVALHRLKHLTEHSTGRILFTTYTKALSENLRESIDRLGVPRERYNLMNISRELVNLREEFGILQDYVPLVYDGIDGSIELWQEVLEDKRTTFSAEFLQNEYNEVILYYGNRTQQEYMLQTRLGQGRSLSRKQRIEIWNYVAEYERLKRERRLFDWSELYNEVTRHLTEHNLHPYDHVISDEIQDFSNPELKFLRALAPEGANDLFLVGDPMQRIYNGRRLNFSAAGVSIRGRSRQLKLNYRTTEYIRRAATAIVSNLEVDNFDGEREELRGYSSLIQGGERPIYRQVADETEELDQVTAWIQGCIARDIRPSEICIAAPSDRSVKAKLVALEKQGYTCYDVRRPRQRDRKVESIAVSTYHSLKGLEFRVVILTGVNSREFPAKAEECPVYVGSDSISQQEFLDSKRSLLYVAMTRAREVVYLVGSGTVSEIVPQALLSGK